MATEVTAEAVGATHGLDQCGWALPELGLEAPCEQPPAKRLSDGEEVRDRRCVFHSHDPDRDPEPVRVGLAGMAEQGRYACPGWVITQGITPPDVPVQQADFRATTFKQAVQFQGVEFNSEADFRHATFDRLADFSGATFRRQRDFSNFGSTKFSMARFVGNAQFSAATFSDVAAFHKTSFEGHAYFRGTTFERGAIFWETRFEQDARFRAVFSVPTTFHEVRFGPKASFGGTELQSLTFRRCQMHGVALAEAYRVAEAEYDQVEWGSYPVRKFDLWQSPVEGVICEEARARRTGRREHFAAAERVYREVRRSLEDHKHFREAHRFGSRELEMRRLGYGAAGGAWGRLRANLTSPEALYFYLSSYGESIWRPVLWLLVVVLFVFPWLFAWAGVDLGAGSYQLASALDGTTWHAYSDLLAFSVRTAALMNDPPQTRLTAGAQIIQVFLRLLAPFLVLLLTLAVRRRLRR